MRRVSTFKEKRKNFKPSVHWYFFNHSKGVENWYKACVACVIVIRVLTMFIFKIGFSLHRYKELDKKGRIYTRKIQNWNNKAMKSF